jgi:hypothetical protein
MLIEEWGADRIMAGQNHILNWPMNSKPLAPEGARLLGSAPLGFMILSCHDSVIHCCLDRSQPRNSAGGSNNPTNRNNNIGLRSVLPSAQSGCQRAAGLTRRPSCPR